ncbi:pentapeptide repeat-containing protein [Yersinia mollaretii]|uniref:pentapeptide repeat-containing protein n=1 Tax=Yersinia mollaretii TaxID=33060 RepID=UPI0011A0141E|nr:pentapeptide repeat-containing protein [Yersinia mollaretii]
MTLITQPNSAEMCMIAEYCSGVATRQALDDLTCPRGILAYIINFFTNGSVRRENAKPYEGFAQAMTTALVQDGSSGVPPYSPPERLVVNFSECTVIFRLPGENHNAGGPVTIEVSKGTEKTEAEVDKDTFCRISTALQLRHKGLLPCTSAVLTDNNGMNLQGANFYKANLSGLDLNEADLSYTNLCGADLRESCLRGACLNYAALFRANLSGVNLSGAYLNWSILVNANLSMANLSGIRHRCDNPILLMGANLSGANLNGVDLYRIDLSGANLSGANLSGANLSGANLRMKDLRGANLCRANLSGADLRGAKLNGADLSDIIQKGALLKLPRWNSTTLDTYLNHINNRESGSLLTMMDSIDDRHADVKLRMAQELMTSLQKTWANTSDVSMFLLSTLSKAPYTNDADITAGLGTLCERYLSQYNGQVLPVNEGVFYQFVDLFTRRPELMIPHNGAFIQIIAQGMAEKSTPPMKEKAAALYQTYLQHERVKPYCSLEDFGDGEGKPDWSDKHAVNFILLSALPARVSAMLLSLASLEGMLRPQVDTAWNNVYLYKDEVNLSPAGSPALDDLFARAFPLFNGPYQQTQKNAKFLLLLKALNLGNLETAFVSATRVRNSEAKLVSEAHQKMLKGLFAPNLTYSPGVDRYGLNDAHYGELVSTYGLASASDAEKGKTLLCLAALFTKYSSSAVFGTDVESPEALRHYAYALMAKAHALDASLVNSGTLADWTNRLLGLPGAFSCSSVLSSMMIGHIRSRFPAMLKNMMPPAWS